MSGPTKIYRYDGRDLRPIRVQGGDRQIEYALWRLGPGPASGVEVFDASERDMAALVNAYEQWVAGWRLPWARRSPP